ncbi:MAG: S8 family peptidase, partial [Solirubrobacteraceae bacterium]
PIVLRHRLESVKMLPDSGADHDPLTYGVVTAEAVAVPEATAARRRRVHCMPITAPPDLPGQPTLWSASIDALAVGVDVARSGDELSIIGAPDPNASRLFVISAGNVSGQDFQLDYRSACDASVIEDPAQAWNALTVGAFTELTAIPSQPSFAGWTALSSAGDISPHSRTSQFVAAHAWPIKPDICMEGGNVLTDGAGSFDESHPLLSLRTTDIRHDFALGSANATSAATAQAARLAALARASYPDFWPETIRGLLTHAAEWTPIMRSQIDACSKKAEKLLMLRRYGWGVPSEEAVLTSSANAVTLVTQDQFIPFDGPDYAARLFRLHRLPWPDETLRTLAANDVSLRVTLSYFIEPTASRRGWRRRYAYASHGLRFELKAPTETLDEFVRRVNQEAQDEEDGTSRPSARPDRWLIGPNQRNLGSLHQDVWEGSGADLADSGVLAVHPVGGWWKNRRAQDRVDTPVRYALIVSLRTDQQGVDLYTPIAVQLQLPIETAVPGT